MLFSNIVPSEGNHFIFIVFCGLIVFVLLYIILFIILFSQNAKLKKSYNKFMTGTDGKNLESAMLSKFEAIDVLQNDVNSLKHNLSGIIDSLTYVYQFVSLIKYDAFKEMGGKLSFSLCMLDAKKNGFILTSMHNSREGCYTYIKEIINGESYILLSEEEKKALEQAKEKASGKR